MKYYVCIVDLPECSNGVYLEDSEFTDVNEALKYADYFNEARDDYGTFAIVEVRKND